MGFEKEQEEEKGRGFWNWGGRILRLLVNGGSNLKEIEKDGVGPGREVLYLGVGRGILSPNSVS